MTPVVPYQIRKSEDGGRGELLLRLKNERVGYMIQLPLDQARVLAVVYQDMLQRPLCPAR